MSPKSTLMDAKAMDRALTRISHEILERNKGLGNIYLVGIQRRGVPIAQRIADKIERFEGSRPEVGVLDITFYRDDLSLLNDNPVVNATHINNAVTGSKIILVDDVIYTGRTIRAAIEAIFDMGRPELIQLAVLIDRGHRELPFRPDYIGKNVPTSRTEQILVHVEQFDDIDEVILVDNSDEDDDSGERLGYSDYDMTEEVDR